MGRRSLLVTLGIAGALAFAGCAGTGGDTSSGGDADSPAGEYITEGKLTIGTGEPAYSPWVLDDDP